MLNEIEKEFYIKPQISRITLSKAYNLLGGCDISEDSICNLHTKNAIFVHFGLTSTDFYHVSHKRICNRYSEKDTANKKQLIEELNLYKLESNFNKIVKNITEIKDSSFQQLATHLPEEDRKKQIEVYNKTIIETDKKEVIDSSVLIISYTNGKKVKISLDYLEKEFINKIENLIENHEDDIVEVKSKDIIQVPLLKFDVQHKKEIEILELLRKSYYDLNFNTIYDLLSQDCKKISFSEKDNYKEILGKENIIKDFKNLVKIAIKHNLIYQGICQGELTDEFDSIVSLSLTGKEKNKKEGNKRSFVVHINLNSENKIDKIEIRDLDIYTSKFLDYKMLEEVSTGEYSDFIF